MGSGEEERDITVASIEEQCPTAAAGVLAAGVLREVLSGSVYTKHAELSNKDVAIFCISRSPVKENDA